MRGGEAVLEAMLELLPRAELLTLLHVPGSVSPKISSRVHGTSWLQRVPGADRRYRHFLPAMPAAIESLDVSGYDLIVSSSHCVAKGVRKRSDAVHLSYVHAPMRYIWDRFDEYFGPGQASPVVRLAARALRPALQAWDRRVSQPARVDRLVSNSRFISDRIRDAYGRDSVCVYPFADLSRFSGPRAAGGEYLMVGAFAPYKRIDLAVEAFNRLKLPLGIVGGGQDEHRLRAMAGPTVKFLGQLSNEEIAALYSKCRAFVFPGVEDFGITPLEAMASGAPVIAYGEGGAAETVIDGQTGILFRPQTVDGLIAAVTTLEQSPQRFSELACRARAAEFSRERFKRELKRELQETWAAAGKPPQLLDPAFT